MNIDSVHDDAIVSFDSELLILVNDQDEEIGYKDKLGCHLDNGLLHRAFSLFIFNDDGQLLLQQRSKNKKLWPLYWSNSCCSHPRHGEAMDVAINRRLQQELGFTAVLNYVYKFKYQVNYLNIGAEHELCSVFVGKSSAPIKSNDNEVAGWRFVDLDELNKEIGNAYITPWFKLEWHKLMTEYSQDLCNLCIPLVKIRS